MRERVVGEREREMVEATGGGKDVPNRLREGKDGAAATLSIPQSSLTQDEMLTQLSYSVYINKRGGT